MGYCFFIMGLSGPDYFDLSVGFEFDDAAGFCGGGVVLPEADNVVDGVFDLLWDLVECGGCGLSGYVG